MSDLTETIESPDKKGVATLSAPAILLRAGLRVEGRDTQRFSAAQFENLTREIDEELTSVRVDYEKKLISLAEEKVELKREYEELLELQACEAGAVLDSQAAHARHCEIAAAGESGIALLLVLDERGGSLEKQEILGRIAKSLGFLGLLVHLGAAGMIEITDDRVALTEAGFKIAHRLTQLAE